MSEFLTVLIIGSNGFVGKNLKAYLGEHIGLLNIFTPSSEACDLLNLGSCVKYLESFRECPALLIINLASEVLNSLTYKNDHLGLFYNNSTMSMNLALAIKKNKLKPRIINLSSIYAYSEFDKSVLVDESMYFAKEPIKNYTGYSYSKRQSSAAFESLICDDPDIKYTELICPNMFGENDVFNIPKSKLIPTIISKCFLKEYYPQIEVFCSSRQELNILYVQDLIKYINYFIYNTEYGRFNLPASKVQIYEIVDNILETMESKQVVVYHEDKITHTNKFDYSKINKLKGFDSIQPTPISKAIKKTIEFAAQNVYNKA